MGAIERGNKEKAEKDESDKANYYSDCLDPLNKYVRDTYVNDNESSHGSLITTMTSNFSENSIFGP